MGKNKKSILLAVLLIAAAVLGYMAVKHNESWYSTTIVKVIDIQTEHTETQQAATKGTENYYVQTITARVQNGESKGRIVSLSNQYTTSGVRDEPYRIGDSLLVQLGSEGTDGKILGQKRDTLIYILAVLLLGGMIVTAGPAGLLAVCSLAVNIALLTFALYCYLDGWNIMVLTAVMILLFTILSLFIGNGVNRRSLLAVIVTLLSLAATAVIFLVVRAVLPDLQYQMLEYAVVPDDLPALFFCEIMVGGLGAVMDVAISLISAADELLKHTPDMSCSQLHDSVQAVSDDIMGTMVNVLLFTYICGGLPEILLMLRNNLTISYVWEYVLSFEMVRFLIGSIGLVLSIPISQIVLRVWMKRRKVKNG